MSVFRKIQEARCKLQELNIKKTGHNKFAGYKYYELGDILPHINNINLELNLCTVVKFSETEATLEIVDTETEKSIIFTSPMADASLKGAHAIQNLGAVQTYQRRYLYMSAYEVVEHDALDSSKPKEQIKDKAKVSQEIEHCFDMESITQLWNELNSEYQISEDIKKEFSLRRKMIESGDINQSYRND